MQEDEILIHSSSKANQNNSNFVFEDLEKQNKPLQKLKLELIKQNEEQIEDIEEAYMLKFEKETTYNEYSMD